MRLVIRCGFGFLGICLVRFLCGLVFGAFGMLFICGFPG